MITRIELTNFMSHEHTVIEPDEGLTVLVGPNNCGKSAVVTALQILAHNENSTYVMRHGTKETRVAVETSEGNSVEWRRKKSGGPSYTVNGRLYDRLSGGVPEEVRQVLKLSKVSSGSGTSREEFDLHFGEQKSPVFLLDQPSSHAARFFASSSDAEKLVRMQTRHKEKVQEAKSERARLVAETSELDDTLSELLPVDEIQREVSAAEGRHADIVESEERVEAGELMKRELEQTSQQVRLVEAEIASLAELAEPPRLYDTPSLENRIDSLTEAERRCAQAGGESSALSRLSGPPELADIADLERLIREVASRDRRTRREQRLAETYSALVSPPDLADPSDLDTLVRELERRAQEHATAEAAAVTAEEELAAAREALRRWAVENRVCPTCGGTVEPDRLVQAVESGLGAHVHDD